MKDIGLTRHEVSLICDVCRGVPDIAQVVLFGSRAKGSHKPQSDIDLAILGVMDPQQIEAIALCLDDLPLPYHFDVVAISSIRHRPLREHIERVGIVLYKRGAQGTRD